MARVRSHWAAPVIGHFGTFSPLVTAVLAPAIVHVLEARADATWLLIGRDGERFARDLAARAPHIGDRLVATGTLSARCAVCARVGGGRVRAAVSGWRHGAAHDAPPRSSATAAPIVTTDGHLTENFWRTDSGVRLVPVGDAAGLGNAAIHLLGDAAARGRLAQGAQRMFAHGSPAPTPSRRSRLPADAARAMRIAVATHTLARAGGVEATLNSRSGPDRGWARRVRLHRGPARLHDGWLARASVDPGTRRTGPHADTSRSFLRSRRRDRRTASPTRWLKNPLRRCTHPFFLRTRITAPVFRA